MPKAAVHETPDYLRTLPGDDVRQIMWRFAERYDLQMLVQSTRGVARGPVARLVAEGARNDHEWTPRKNELLAAYDASGITATFMEPEEGGFITGPKNLALALTAFELAWVDAGAATGALAGFLGLSPIHERGTPEQARHYMSLAAPPEPGENRKPWRAAFALTEPIPYVGVDTGMLSGKVRVKEWKEGQEPLLQVEKRGRFITNMGFANFVTAAVDTADPRIKSSCMIILEEGDPGTYDRGTPTKKLVHQLSSTSDPIFSLTVPASRIVGGYSVKDGVIVPTYDHSAIIDAVFRRTRVTVGVMTAAKLLSAIEPVIRYQRGRFRGAEQAVPGSVRYELGIQQREDALHRLVEVWATGEAAASLGFATARLFDELDPLERKKDAFLQAQGVSGMKATMKWMKTLEKGALELLDLQGRPPGDRDEKRLQELRSGRDGSVRPARRPGQRALPGHQALEHRPRGQHDARGRLAHGRLRHHRGLPRLPGPEVDGRAARGHLRGARGGAAPAALDHDGQPALAGPAPEPGPASCATSPPPTPAPAPARWPRPSSCGSGPSITCESATDADGQKLYQSPRQGVTFKLADALCWLRGRAQQILDAVALAEGGRGGAGDALPGTARFFEDLCHVQAARAAGEVGRICAELVHGYNRHPLWDEEARRACWSADDAEALEGIVPGLAGCGMDQVDHHPDKAGPCASCKGITDFRRLRVKIDGCLTGAMLAKDRAAEAVSKVMIPEALDYPV